MQKNRKDCHESYRLDLSGNHFGTKKIKKKKGAAKLADKASSNIKFIGKTLKGAAKRFSSEGLGITGDSDDDEEVMGGLIEDEEDFDEDKIQACGGYAFAGEILTNGQKSQSQEKDSPSISVGMRNCFLGEGAIDSLAASIVGATNCKLSIDTSMNSVDEDIVNALMDPNQDKKLISTLAKRHMDFLDG